MAEVRHCPVYTFLKRWCPPPEQDASATHVLMCGAERNERARFNVENQLATLYDKIADALIQAHISMPPLVEQHTLVFPMYVDLDFKIPVNEIAASAWEKLMAVLTSQLQKFYDPLTQTPDQFDAILLVKTHKDGSVCKGVPCKDAPELFKHGAHVHFPRVHVTATQALQIRLGFTSGLNNMQHDWVPHLGLTRPAWDDIVDEGVYSHGIRMIGAPKAHKCACFTTKGLCTICDGHNNRHVIDDRVYWLYMAFRDGRRYAPYEEELRRHTKGLIGEVSVRLPDSAVATPGYAIYAGCPPILPSSASTSGRAGKRARPSDSDAGRVERKFRIGNVVTDSFKVAIAKRQLVKHSDKYASCNVELRQSKTTMCVILSGDGSTWCANKRDYHKRNRAYMIIRRGTSASDYVSVMKCHCKCVSLREGEEKKFVDGSKPMKRACKDFTSQEVQLNIADAKRLLATAETVPATSSNIKDPHDSLEATRLRWQKLVDEAKSS